MKPFVAILMLTCYGYLHTINAQTLSTDATGKSVIISRGGSVGVDFQRAVFNTNYMFSPNSMYNKTSPLLGFSLTGGNRNGMTDVLKNGITAGSIDLRAYIGFSAANEYPSKYEGLGVYAKKLKDEKSRIELELAMLAADSAYKTQARLLFYGKYARYTDSVIKIYERYFPVTADIKRELIRLVQRSGGVDNLDFEYTMRQYIRSVLSSAAGYKAREQKLLQVKHQLADTNRLPKTFVRTSVYFSGGFSSFQFTQISFIKTNTNAYRMQMANKPHEHFAGIIGINHQFGASWFLGYGLGMEFHDNFEQLKQLKVDSTWALQTGQSSFATSYTGYTGNYSGQSSVPFLFQLTYVGHITNFGSVIFTPLYASLGKRKQVGASASLVMKNRFSFGVNIEQLVITNALTGIKDQKLLSFGFRLQYFLTNFNLYGNN
jgi:hypothetical protein